MSEKKFLIVDDKGNINYDNKEISKVNLNSVFLDQLFREALRNNIEFKIDETSPISKLFLRIQEETAASSEFSKQINSLRQEYHQNTCNSKKVELAQITDEMDLNDILWGEDL